MQTFLQLLFSGLALGSIYALVALGFVVIYRASQVFNFAHGEFLMLGAFLMISLVGAGLPWVVALAVTMAVTGTVGMGVERVVLRPMIGRPVFVTVIVTIFVGALMRVAINLIWGGGERGMPTPWDPTSVVEILGARVLYNSIAAIAATAVVLVGFYWLFQRSRIGVGMRATASDQEVALGLGIPVGRVFATSWFLAGAMAALAGVFLGMFPRIVDGNIWLIALAAFPAVLIGGLESPLGAVIGGLALGVTQLLAQGYVNPLLGEFGNNFHRVFPYVIMIGFLMVRPYGLFGTREVERV
ncbi:MAG: branched-chain amino acid ABC transporter permease [Nitriliruptoraceae bacterium]